MPRIHTQFDGQVITPFTVLTEFQRNAGAGFSFNFDTFKSVADFNADGVEISRLRFRVDPATGFAAAKATLLTDLRNLMLGEMGLGGRGFTFTEFQWFPIQKVITCSALKGDVNQIYSRRGADYDAFITANAVLFDNLNAAAWTHAKAGDAFLNAMTAAV